MIILGHCCVSGRSHHVCPLIYTFSMPTVSISYIMAILFVVNLCNALSDFHGTSDVIPVHICPYPYDYIQTTPLHQVTHTFTE